MNHILFGENQESYDIAILIKPSHFNEQALRNYYVNPLKDKGVSPDKVIAFDLSYVNNKAGSKVINAYLLELLPVLKELGIKYIYCADASYFKVLAKQPKADGHFGYMFNVAQKGYEHMQVTIGLNHGALIYNPEQIGKLDMSIEALASTIKGDFIELGVDVIQYEDYPQSLQGIEWTLNSLHKHNLLVCDIETFSLEVHKAGLASMGFAWSKHEGVAFPIDYVPHSEGKMPDGTYGYEHRNEAVRKLLRRFFETYAGTIIFHNATYDTKVIIYNLWMKDPLDRIGLLHGLHTMYTSLHDTKIIAYLATNSTAGNELGLKTLAHEYSGNWAEGDIKNVKLIELDNLLRYNLKDCLSTFYVFEKYMPVMIADKQEDLYKSLMIPSQKLITQIELIGMPMNVEMIQKAKKELTVEENKALTTIMASPDVARAELMLQVAEMNKANEKLKKKVKPLEDFAHIKFNPNSGQHVAMLIHTVMGLPVFEYTKTKLPATGASTLEKLLNHTTGQRQQVIQALVDLSSVSKILTAFIPAFEKAVPKADGVSYLHGSFNLGGTLSGRLSSSSPNLQNLPSGSKWGKLIKQCFAASSTELFVGADFAALEDRINTLLTKDPNKLKIYTEGYDGHCFRAFYYWGDKMPDIVDTVDSINSIKDNYGALRNKSKAPSFALQYAGTWATLVKNCGFSKEEALEVEANYHKMYSVSDDWMKEQIQTCADKGYATVAFGLRIRTPLLKQTILGTRSTPKEAEAEARSVGNAISGQSYGLLNNRAACEFMQRVWDSEYKYDVVPVALIHDAIYLIIKDDIEIVDWVNNNLTECMAWNELPEIQHPQIKLSAELDIYYPNWANAITLPNNTVPEQVSQICKLWYAENMKEVM